VLQLIEHGKAQLGLVGKKSTHPSLEFRPFARDRMVLVVPAQHRWARRKQVSLTELCQQPLILREIGQLVEQGVREVVLVGQDTTRYGHDLGERDGLAELLEQRNFKNVLHQKKKPRSSHI